MTNQMGLPKEGRCPSLVDYSQPGQSDWRNQLNRLRALNAPLLAIGAGENRKAPAVPTSGVLFTGWTKGAHTIEEIQAAVLSVIGAGMRTGNGLITFDVDGTSAVAWLLEQGCDPAKTDTWQIHRDTDSDRLKAVFKVSDEQQRQIGEITTKIPTQPPIGDKKGEAVEIFNKSSSQVVVIGEHPTSGGNYYWPEGKGPEALAPLPECWLRAALLIIGVQKDAKNSHARKGEKPVTLSGDWRPLSDCPICGRNTTSYCSKHRDGKTIRCFQGSTFAPPTGLKAGETIDDRHGKKWAFSKEQYQTNGHVFSIFVEDKPNRKPKPSTEIKRFPAKEKVDPGPGLPSLRKADVTAPAGQYLGEVVPLPIPAKASLVVEQAPMGCGKTQQIAEGIEPRIAAGLATLLPTHRIALGKATCEKLGIEWAPLESDPWRGLGGGLCLDSLCPTSGLRVRGDSFTGATIVLDEWMQALEHLLFSSGTKLADRRPEVLRTISELLSSSSQIIAADAQLDEWAVQLLEIITNRKAFVIKSDHKPMQGRELHHHVGQAIKQTTEAFQSKWNELVSSGATFLCWTSAQKHEGPNSPYRLAQEHRRLQPTHRVCVIDSTTPELAEELATSLNAFAENYDAIYASPTISSGISFDWDKNTQTGWKPDAVLVFSGGHIGPEHVVQACARVRCPDVPAYVFAPDQAPGNGLRVGSGNKNPAELIKDLKAVTDPLFGQLSDAGNEWLDAWAEAGARRNRQRYCYGSTIVELLKREGWREAATSMPPDGAQRQRTSEFKEQTETIKRTQVARLVAAETISELEAREISKIAKPQRTEEQKASLERFELEERWCINLEQQKTSALEGGVAEDMIDIELVRRYSEIKQLEAKGTQHHLELGWIIRNEDLIKQMRIDDSVLIEELDPVERQPFSPDRLRVTISPKVAVLRSLKIHQLIERFENGEIIATSDPLFQAIHSKAQTHSGKVTTALGITPAKTASGTISRLLGICGWQLNSRSRCRQRGSDRDATLYSAAPIAMPDGISYQDLIQRFDTDFESGANASLSTKCVGNDLPQLRIRVVPGSHQTRRHRPSPLPSGPPRSAPDIRNRVRSIFKRVKSAAGFG